MSEDKKEKKMQVCTPSNKEELVVAEKVIDYYIETRK